MEGKEIVRIENNKNQRQHAGYGILLACGCLGVGLLAALCVAGISGVAFGVYLFPFSACVGVFCFSTWGFFVTSERKELLYGACSIVGAACAIVQLAILF